MIDGAMAAGESTVGAMAAGARKEDGHVSSKAG
jgi:hypothetical protein